MYKVSRNIVGVNSALLALIGNEFS